uniref:ADAM metallopeptidase domain 28 n=1 Tax=Cyprinus carpio carpio TaxID=630221 RepID=A0A8C0XWC2_CYPCA
YLKMYILVWYITVPFEKVYEIVRPIRLHALQKRDLKSRPDTVKYAMTLGGRDIKMHLQKNDGILTKDYSETYYTKDGMLVTNTPKDLDLCYYHGKIVNDSKSSVSMSTCDGLRGYFQTEEQRFLIEPLSEDGDGDHAVYKYENVNEETPRVCGVTNTSWDESEEIGPPRILKSRSRSSVRLLLETTVHNIQYSNILIFYFFFFFFFAVQVYKEINTFVALTGFEVWTDSDKIQVSSVAEDTLNRFTQWRNSDLIKRQKHDNAHLLSAVDIDGITVGVANTGSLCGSLSTAIDHNSNAIPVGATMAHEMGHNLGMDHDSSGCVCSDSTCIMTAKLSYFIPQHFSSCSSSNYVNYLNKRNPECLLNMPKPKELIQPPVCGNGFVETGEECDCGTVQGCTNPCCNALTCKLTEGSQCATGECCENCKIMSAAHVCRPKNDECDLPESCTGKSAWCPEDVFTVNGIPCKNGKGYCYNGQCPQREEQCIKMWGPTAVVARKYCYDQNTRTEYYAHCKRNGGRYIACQGRDVMCGKLFCENGDPEPNYGQLVIFSECKATFYSSSEDDYGQVDTGTKCGEGMVCNQNECVDLEKAYKATNCSAKCKGHAVCDHRMECRCEPGWLPPDCETPAESDGLSKSSTTDIALKIASYTFSFDVITTLAPPPPPPSSVQSRVLHNDCINARQVAKLTL